MLIRVLKKLSSRSVLLLTVSLELEIILQNIWRRVVGGVLIDTTPSNIFSTMLLLKRFHQVFQALLAAPRVNGLTLMLLVANFTNTQWCKKTWKMTETLANGYSSERTQWWELSNEYQHDRVQMFLRTFFLFFSLTKLASAWKGLNICRCMRPCEMVNHWYTNNNTAKIFGQKTDTKRLTNVRTANGYKSAHATVCALKHWSTVCCPMYGFLPVIISCILQKCYFLDFHWIFLSFLPIYRCTNDHNRLTSVIFCCVLHIHLHFFRMSLKSGFVPAAW